MTDKLKMTDELKAALGAVNRATKPDLLSDLRAAASHRRGTGYAGCGGNLELAAAREIERLRAWLAKIADLSDVNADEAMMMARMALNGDVP